MANAQAQNARQSFRPEWRPPGYRKALADIGGVPMVVRVARPGAACRIARVAVATDSTEIARSGAGRGIEAVMNPRMINQSGSDPGFRGARKDGSRRPERRSSSMSRRNPGDEPETIAAPHCRCWLAGRSGHAWPSRLRGRRENQPEPSCKVVGTPIAPGCCAHSYFTTAPRRPWRGPLYQQTSAFMAWRPAGARNAFSRFSLQTLERRESARSTGCGRWRKRHAH